jgi:Uma2 family endonuclease
MDRRRGYECLQHVLHGAMTTLAKTPIRMSVSDFLRWDSQDGLRYELVDGELRAMAPASTIHGFLQNELGRLIGNQLRARNSNCEILANPGVIPHLLSAHNARVPDLGVTCSPLLPGQATLPDPVLLIEILSPSNQAKTWSNVWAYTSIPSVQEILVLHSGSITAELLRRSAAGEWPEEPEQLTGSDLTLTSIDFRVPMTELYARTGLAS